MIATLTPDLEEFIQSEISTGHFASREALIAAAISELRHRQSQLERLRQELALDDDSADGESVILETAEDFRAFAEDVITRGKERLVKERGQS